MGSSSGRREVRVDVVVAEGRLWDLVVVEGKLFVEDVASMYIVSELREYPGGLAVHSAIPISPSDNPTRTFRPIGTIGPGNDPTLLYFATIMFRPGNFCQGGY
jgi:hypothetical protein